MKKRFREVVDDISYEDLIKISDDLKNGGLHLKALIEEKIRGIEAQELKLCATCGAVINPHFTDDFRLEFGRYDFKKRAYFCGLDCMRHFISELEAREKEKLAKY
ncbi:MAG: hypothetical protein ABIG95_02305 [Candidatus Woesearchaeota archaeon]